VGGDVAHQAEVRRVPIGFRVRVQAAGQGQVPGWQEPLIRDVPTSAPGSLLPTSDGGHRAPTVQFGHVPFDAEVVHAIEGDLGQVIRLVVQHSPVGKLAHSDPTSASQSSLALTFARTSSASAPLMTYVRSPPPRKPFFAIAMNARDSSGSRTASGLRVPLNTRPLPGGSHPPLS